MTETNFAYLLAPMGNIEAWSTENNIEVKSIDTNAWVVLDSQVNMLLDAETKISSAWEVVFPQLVLSYLQMKSSGHSQSNTS